MTAYAGVDFSTRAVDLVLLDETGRASYRHFPLEGADALARTRAVREAMPSRGWWEDAGVVALGIEEPMGRGSVIGKLKAVQGAVLACLPEWLLVEALEPARWRRVVGLPGNATKDAVAEFVRQQRGLIYSYSYRPAVIGSGYSIPPDERYAGMTYDESDAYCLALAVSRLTEGVAV